MKLANQAASAAIRDENPSLAATLAERAVGQHPELQQNRRDNASGLAKSSEQASELLAHLAEALALDNRALFVDYVAWAKVMLARRNGLSVDLAFELECTALVLREHLSVEAGALAADFVAAAVQALPDMPDDLPTFLQEGAPLSPLAHQYLQALLRGERHLASRLVLDAVDRGTPVRDIYLHVFQPAQYEIGRLWQINRISVAQEHYCTAATQLIMSQLYPHIFAAEKNGRRLVATCVSGDLHELGARMVADFFEMAGWDTFYTGANTPHADVIRTVIEREADVLAVSATIAYHVGEVEELIAAVRARPECARTRILVGGYPFNRDPQLWRHIGADGFAADADAAIATAERLVATAGDAK